MSQSVATNHKHAWRSNMHLDGCHWFTTGYTCQCGATASKTDERSPMADPYSLVWMEPTYEWVNRDERGRFCKPYQREAVCNRCAELRAGAPTRFDLVIVAKNGTVEKEVHDEHAQEPEDDDDAE